MLDLDIAKRQGLLVVGQLFIFVRFASVERAIAKYEGRLLFVTDKRLGHGEMAACVLPPSARLEGPEILSVLRDQGRSVV